MVVMFCDCWIKSIWTVEMRSKNHIAISKSKGRLILIGVEDFYFGSVKVKHGIGPINTAKVVPICIF